MNFFVSLSIFTHLSPFCSRLASLAFSSPGALSVMVQSHSLSHGEGELRQGLCHLCPKTKLQPSESQYGGGLEMCISVLGGGVSPACVAACIRAHWCLLRGYTAQVPVVFMFLLQRSHMLIWRGNACSKDTGGYVGLYELQTRSLPTQTYWTV